MISTVASGRSDRGMKKKGRFIERLNKLGRDSTRERPDLFKIAEA